MRRTKLIAYREALGMTQEGLAREVGISRSTIAKYEIDKIDIPASVLQRLARTLKAPMEELLISEEAQPEEPAHVGN